FPSLCRGIRSEFRVSHAPAVSSEPPGVLHHWIGLWVRRFFRARVGHLASGDDRWSHSSQAWSVAGDVADRYRIRAAQRNAGAADRFLAGAHARAPANPGTFLPFVYSLHDLVEFCFAADAALQCVDAAGPPALAAILGVVTAFACWPRLGSNRPSSSCRFSIEFRAPSPVRGSVQCLLVASVCHAIPRGRAQ